MKEFLRIFNNNSDESINRMVMMPDREMERIDDLPEVRGLDKYVDDVEVIPNDDAFKTGPINAEGDLLSGSRNNSEGTRNDRDHHVSSKIEHSSDMVAIEDEPVVNEPVVNEPVVNEPVVNEPVVNEPVVNESVVNEPVDEFNSILNNLDNLNKPNNPDSAKLKEVIKNTKVDNIKKLFSFEGEERGLKIEFASKIVSLLLPISSEKMEGVNYFLEAFNKGEKKDILAKSLVNELGKISSIDKANEISAPIIKIANDLEIPRTSLYSTSIKYSAHMLSENSGRKQEFEKIQAYLRLQHSMELIEEGNIAVKRGVKYEILEGSESSTYISHVKKDNAKQGPKNRDKILAKGEFEYYIRADGEKYNSSNPEIYKRSKGSDGDFELVSYNELREALDDYVPVIKKEYELQKLMVELYDEAKEKYISFIGEGNKESGPENEEKIIKYNKNEYYLRCSDDPILNDGVSFFNTKIPGIKNIRDLYAELYVKEAGEDKFKKIEPENLKKHLEYYQKAMNSSSVHNSIAKEVEDIIDNILSGDNLDSSETNIENAVVTINQHAQNERLTMDISDPKTGNTFLHKIANIVSSKKSDDFSQLRKIEEDFIVPLVDRLSEEYNIGIYEANKAGEFVFSKLDYVDNQVELIKKDLGNRGEKEIRPRVKKEVLEVFDKYSKGLNNFMDYSKLSVKEYGKDFEKYGERLQAFKKNVKDPEYILSPKEAEGVASIQNSIKVSAELLKVEIDFNDMVSGGLLNLAAVKLGIGNKKYNIDKQQDKLSALKIGFDRILEINNEKILISREALEKLKLEDKEDIDKTPEERELESMHKAAIKSLEGENKIFTLKKTEDGKELCMSSQLRVLIEQNKPFFEVISESYKLDKQKQRDRGAVRGIKEIKGAAFREWVGDNKKVLETSPVLSNAQPTDGRGSLAAADGFSTARESNIVVGGVDSIEDVRGLGSQTPPRNNDDSKLRSLSGNF